MIKPKSITDDSSRWAASGKVFWTKALRLNEMDAYRAMALAEGFEQGTEEEIKEAWQYLHDTGLAYRLQGWFGRTAQSLDYLIR